MTVKQISVFVENKEGKLAEFTDILAQHGVDTVSYTHLDVYKRQVYR